MMAKRSVSNKFLQVLTDEINEAGGVSADITQEVLLTPINAWFFPKYSSKTRIIPKEVNLSKEIASFIEDNREHFEEQDTILGVWLNPDTIHYYLDITTYIEDLEKAKKVAKEISIKEGRKIVTLYNPYLKKIVYLWEDVRS